MGDRISISFKNGTEESVVLFNHWEGIYFKKNIENYYKELKKDINGQTMPLDRLEPNTVMIDFIRWLTKDEKRIESSIYLGADEFAGDNSDNGHWTFDLLKGKWCNLSPKDSKKVQIQKAKEILKLYEFPEDILKQITAWQVAENV